MNFNGFDLNLLRVLNALLLTRSTVAAGRRVGLSQPAVSSALKRLRAALGDPLLVRKGKQFVPTDYALSIEEPLRRALDEIEATLAGGDAFDPASYRGAFRISGSDFFAEMLMPELTERLAAEAPGIRIHLVDLTADQDLEVLDRRQSDLVLLPRIDYPDWVRSQGVFVARFVVAARRGHAALAATAPETPIPLDLYCSLSHVLFSPEGRSSALGDAALAAIGRSRRVAMSLPVFSGVCRVAARTDMLALVPEAFARRLAPELGLELYQPPMPVGAAQLDMVWHARSDANSAHR